MRVSSGSHLAVSAQRSRDKSAVRCGRTHCGTRAMATRGSHGHTTPLRQRSGRAKRPLEGSQDGCADARVWRRAARPKPAKRGLSTGLCWLSRQAAARHCMRPAQLRVERADGGRVALEGRGGEGVELIDRDAQRVLHHRLREERGSAQRDAMHRAAPSAQLVAGSLEGARQPTVHSFSFSIKGNESGGN